MQEIKNEICPKSDTSTNNCILCINTTSKTTKIFGEQGDALKIADTLCQHFWFTFTDTDKSQEICVICWEKVDQFHQFYDSVQLAHLQNEERLNFVPKDDVSANDDWQLDNNYDTDDGMDSDKEDVENTKLQPVDTVTNVKEGEEEETLKTLDTNANGSAKQTAPKLENSTTDPGHLDAEQRVAEYFRMNCDLCGEQLNSLRNVTSHFTKKHKRDRGYLICFCKKKAKVRRAVIEHVQWHMNPNMFQCDECCRNFNEKRALRKHKEGHKVREEDLFCCTVCEKRFVTQGLLTQHVFRVHPPDNQRFTCDICEKVFKIKVILEAHMKYKHSGTAQQYICDICAKVLSTKQSLKEHTNTHIENTPRLQCDICGASLKNRICLTIHMKSHMDSKQTCDVCFQVKANRTALLNHKRRVHGAARHKCNLCEKAFCRLIALKEHVATHTGENLYTCNYCPQRFKSNSNMYKHMKQAHPELWKNDRKRR